MSRTTPRRSRGRRMGVHLLRLAAVVGAALLAPAPAVAFGPNLLGNPGFEQPVVAGDVVQPAGTYLGPCQAENHCWLVVNDTVDVIHDDFQTGGVRWAPFAGHQLVRLSPVLKGSNTGTTRGIVRQTVAVPPSTTFELRLAYGADPSSPAGKRAPLLVIISMCEPSSPLWCPDTYTDNVSAASTGDPSAIGWRTLKFQVASTAAEQVMILQIQTVPRARHLAAASVIDQVRFRSL